MQEILTASKELETKKMKMRIEELNQWIRDAGYPVIVHAKERTKEDRKKENRFSSIIGSPSTLGDIKTFNDIVSHVLRIHVEDIYWYNDTTALIIYRDL